MIKNKAVFLDRDGVINLEKDYVYRISDFVFIDGVFEACIKLIHAGYKIIIITNQAGIGRGYYTEQDYLDLTDWMLEQFRLHGIDITAVYHCPHHPEHGLGDYLRACQCRKPEPGMLLLAADEHELDLASSILVGDKLSDIQAAKTAGVGRCFLVKTGHAISALDSMQADGVLSHLAAVANVVC